MNHDRSRRGSKNAGLAILLLALGAAAGCGDDDDDDHDDDDGSGGSTTTTSTTGAAPRQFPVTVRSPTSGRYEDEVEGGEPDVEVARSSALRPAGMGWSRSPCSTASPRSEAMLNGPASVTGDVAITHNATLTNAAAQALIDAIDVIGGDVTVTGN